MIRASLGRTAAGRLLGVLGMGVIGLVAPARADVIVLRGGGQVEGKVLPAPAAAPEGPAATESKAKAKPKPGAKPNPGDERVEVLLLKSKTPLVLRRAQILEVVPRPSPLDDYLVKRAKAAAGSAPAQLELARWCESQKLDDLARVHYEAALKYDDSLVEAHKKLGHVEHDGRWVSRDELRRAQGLTRHKGRWVTEEEKAKQEEEALTTAGQASWVRRIKLMVQNLRSGAPDRKREAETQFMQIRDPEAVWPLMKVMAGGDVALRTLLAQTLGEIPGKESARALVRMMLSEEEDLVRGVVIDRLKKSDDPTIEAQLIRALGSEDLRVVNRAAWALGRLDAVAAVPRLLNVLVTYEQRLVLVPAATASQGPGGYPPILMAWNGTSAAYMLPPAVGPGVVAFGATVVPGVYTINPATGLPGPSVYPEYNTPTVGASRGPSPQLMTFTYQNVEVLGALVKLTEQDFGYDVDLWREWVARSFNPRPNPARRIPQP